MDVDDALDGAGHAACPDVDDPHRARLPRGGRLERAERVGRLARLGQGDHEDARPEHLGLRVVLAGGHGARGHAREGLDGAGAVGRGEEGRAAGDEVDALDRREVGRGDGELVKAHAPVHEVEARGDEVADAVRLLEHLLQHPVRVRALPEGGLLVAERLGRARPRGAVGPEELQPVSRQEGDLVLAELDDAVGAPRERADVGGEERLRPPEPDHQRGAAPERDDRPREALREEREREAALAAPEDLSRGRDRVAAERPREEVREDLGVGLRGERDALAFELLAERDVVLEDAVVDDHDVAGCVPLRVGVSPRRLPVGGPAGVADAGAALERRCVPGGSQLLDAALVLLDAQRAVVRDGHSRAVVAAVGEEPDALDEHRQRLPLARIGDDPAHRASGPLFGERRPRGPRARGRRSRGREPRGRSRGEGPSPSASRRRRPPRSGRP